MRILLVSKWIDGGTKGDFHHSGVWRDTFELACAFSDLGEEVAIVSPRANPRHCKEFQKQYGEILKNKKIKHYFANISPVSGRYEGSLMLRLDLALIFASRDFRPDVVQFLQFTTSLAHFFAKASLFSYYGVILPQIFIGKDGDDKERIKNWSSLNFSPFKAAEHFLYFLLLKILKRDNLYHHPEGIMIAKHKRAYEILKNGKKNNVFYVNKGVDIKKFEIRERKNTQNILYIGSLTYRKGIFDLIEAFLRISLNFPKARLLIAGTGPTGIVNRLRKDIKKRNKSIRIIGVVNYKDKNKIYGDAQIFCLPSYSDASPGVIMEAMAAGLPIVTTYETDAPINDGVEGILVRAGDVDRISMNLRNLLTRAKLRKMLGRMARNRVEKLDWKKQSEEMLKIYQQEMNRS